VAIDTGKDFIQSWVELYFDSEYQGVYGSKRLPRKLVSRLIDMVQRRIARVAGLIPTCYHWSSIAGQGEYLLVNNPDLYVRAYSPRAFLYYDKQLLTPAHRGVINQLRENSLSSGTPISGAVDQRGRKIMVVLHPAPDKTAGDSTWANDPIHFYCYRLPKSIEERGELEIASELHDLLWTGVMAKVAEKLGDSRVGSWQAEYEFQLNQAQRFNGIRNPQPVRVRDVLKNSYEKEITWTGITESC